MALHLGLCAGGCVHGYGNSQTDMEIRPEDPETETKEETNKQKETEWERCTDIQRDEWRGKKRNRKRFREQRKRERNKEIKREIKKERDNHTALCASEVKKVEQIYSDLDNH